MRTGLLLALATTAALSAWALLNPASDRVVSAAPITAESTRQVGGRNSPSMTAGDSPAMDSPASVVSEVAGGPAPAALPAQWPTPGLERAERSPFLPPTPPSAPTPQVIQPVVAAPGAPPSPTMNYRFWGDMTNPDGRRTVYVVLGDTSPPIQIVAGTRLADGFIVENVSDTDIVFLHEPSQQTFVLKIPAREPEHGR
jgi:hypothetical protein